MSINNNLDVADMGDLIEDFNEIWNSCKYQKVCEINAKKDPADLYVLHLNIQGFKKKLFRLKMFIQALKDRNIDIDLILICETFIPLMNDNIINIFSIEGYKSEMFVRNHGHRGGVL